MRGMFWLGAYIPAIFGPSRSRPTRYTKIAEAEDKLHGIKLVIPRREEMPVARMFRGSKALRLPEPSQFFATSNTC